MTMRDSTIQSLRRTLRPLRRLGLACRRFARQDTGVAGIEFAYIAPVLILMFVGVVETCRAISIDRRLSQATSLVADLVAREETITAADMTAIYDIVEQTMVPFDSSVLKMSVIPVKASSTDASQTKVYAATTNRPSLNSGSVPGKCTAYSLSSGLVDKGEAVIVVEASYAYTPLFAGALFNSSTWTQKAILSPRNSCIDFDGDNCVSSCF